LINSLVQADEADDGHDYEDDGLEEIIDVMHCTFRCGGCGCGRGQTRGCGFLSRGNYASSGGQGGTFTNNSNLQCFRCKCIGHIRWDRRIPDHVLNAIEDCENPVEEEGTTDNEVTGPSPSNDEDFPMADVYTLKANLGN